MVRIICRIKPPKEDNIEIVEDSKKIYLYKKGRNLLDKSIIKPYQFELDKFYDYNISTERIYKDEIKPKLFNDFGVFIYGHTGSGKTYTMFGNSTDKGIFDLISDEFDIDYELEAVDLRYNGIFDLFTNNKIVLYSNGKEDTCHNSKKQKINSENYEYFKNKIMESRTTGRSKHNNTSSRSHLVLYIYKNNKKYTIVDLAGNERKPKLYNKKNEYETTYINSSLLALKECFRSYGKSYMPYRRSDLTRLLKKIITKKNLIICTIHSGFPYFYDSIDTLNYIYSLLNKVKSKPDFFEKKVLPMSPKNKNKKKKLPSLNIKNSRVGKKLITPKDLFISSKDLISAKDSLSPKNCKYKDPLDESATESLFMQKVAESKHNDLKIELDNLQDDYSDDYEDFEENSNDDEEDNIIDNALKSQAKDLKEDNLIDEESFLKRYLPEYKSKLKDVDYRRKIVGIVNNLLYKKIVSNYKILLDENLDNAMIDKLIFTTASTLEVSINEILKM